MNRILIASAAVCLVFAPTSLWAQKKDKPVPVVVAQVQKLSSLYKIDLPGTVIPWATTRLAAEIDGRVDDIMVREGQFVRKGDPLLQLRTVPMQLELELSLAEAKRVATLLEELKNGTRPETVEAARFNQGQAQARLNLAQNELKRIDKLYREGVVSLDDYDKSKSEADAAQAEYEEKTEILKELEAGPRREKIQQAEADLEAAEARVKIIEDNIQRATLRAPFNGYIVKKETEVGEWLEKGDAALSITAAYPVKIEVNLPQYHYNSVRVGDKARVFLEDTATGNIAEGHKGKVIEMVTSADPNSRTFPVRIRVDTSGSRMAHGMLVRVEIYPSPKSGRQLYIPKDAIVQTPAETSVWLVNDAKTSPEGSVRKVKVTTGDMRENLIAITSAKNEIKANHWVVVQGNERLKPDSQISIVRRQ